MRARSAVAACLPVALTTLFLACVDTASNPPLVNGDASTPQDARAGEASTLHDAGAPDVAADATTVEDAAADAPSDAAADGATGDASDAAVEAGAPNRALTFDGVDDIVELATGQGAANEAAFTVEVWFKTTSPTGTFFEVYGNGGADRFVFIENGKVCFYVYASPYVKICSMAAIYADGAWHHAAGTLGAIGGTQLYVDGAVVASSATPTASAFTQDTNFRLGYGHTDFVSAFVYFAGSLDEVRVWSTERSAAEILANYRVHVAADAAGLQGNWALDDYSITGTAVDAGGQGLVATTVDSTANAHTGTLNGFTLVPPPWSAPGAF